MRKNNKNWKVCAELLNEIAKEAEWDKAKSMPYNEMKDKVTNSYCEVIEDWTAAYKYKDYEEGFVYCIFNF